MKFTIGIFQREINPHAACFEDYASALCHALERLGHEVLPFGADGKPQGRFIVFGVNNAVVDPNGYQFPKDAIIFNTEQLAAVDKPEMFMAGHANYRNHAVWDYSHANIEAMKKLGIERGVYCPLGYIDKMTKPWANEDIAQDIDVLFYGSTNPHRLKVLDGLDAAGLKLKRVDAAHPIYGAERDKLIARSKIVLNMHHYERGVFEIFRVSHLVANKKCVVSEDGGVDEELNALGRNLTWAVDYEELVGACLRLVNDDAERQHAAEHAHRHFRALSLVDAVRDALAAS